MNHIGDRFTPWDARGSSDGPQSPQSPQGPGLEGSKDRPGGQVLAVQAGGVTTWAVGGWAVGVRSFVLGAGFRWRGQVLPSPASDLADLGTGPLCEMPASAGGDRSLDRTAWLGLWGQVLCALCARSRLLVGPGPGGAEWAHGGQVLISAPLISAPVDLGARSSDGLGTAFGVRPLRLGPGHRLRLRGQVIGVRSRLLWISGWVLMLMGVAACRPALPDSGAGEVVLYCAQDQVVAEPLLAEFTRQTGIRVRTVFDSEAVKTVGLANRLLAERSHPTAEVFWGNEELRTRQLAAAGVFRCPEGWWSFGRRTRCWVVRSGASGPVDRSGQPLAPPASLTALTNAAWRGQISMAFPLFGTTATHFLALRQHWGPERWRTWCKALFENQPFLEEGNSHVVRRVARGEALIGLTDSDDVQAARREGLSVMELPLDDLTLFMPNTVALVGRLGGTRPQAESLVTFLRSPEVEARLVAGGALRPNKGPTASGLQPEWDRLVAELDAGVRALEGIFRR